MAPAMEIQVQLMALQQGFSWEELLARNLHGEEIRPTTRTRVEKWALTMFNWTNVSNFVES